MPGLSFAGRFGEIGQHPPEAEFHKKLYIRFKYRPKLDNRIVEFQIKAVPRIINRSHKFSSSKKPHIRKTSEK